VNFKPLLILGLLVSAYMLFLKNKKADESVQQSLENLQRHRDDVLNRATEQNTSIDTPLSFGVSNRYSNLNLPTPLI